MQAFVPKNRRLKFELQLRIHDLNNIPLVKGSSYVKWHTSSNISTENHGCTSKAEIKDHKVVWDYHKTFSVRLTTDKTNMLEKSEIDFDIWQEYAYGGSRNEKIELGKLTLNLAEYADQEPSRAAGDEESRTGDTTEELGVTRRYLMRESKINSTLKISILMAQTEGDRSYITPPLRTAPVFGGIAGVLTHETHENSSDEAGPYTSKLTHHAIKPTEIGEAQDMYRRTLTASWGAQFGELPADECIENIFAGGSGWKDGFAPSHGSSDRSADAFMHNTSRVWGNSGLGVGAMSSVKGHRKGGSSGGSSLFGSKKNGSSPGKTRPASLKRVEGTSSSGDNSDVKRQGRAGLGQNTIEEIDAREDMRSWVFPQSKISAEQAGS